MESPIQWFSCPSLNEESEHEKSYLSFITDRNDLDEQLSQLFLNSKSFIGDSYIKQIDSRSNLKEELNNRKSGGVFLTTIQKFSEDINVLSDRENIICISDEAHRSQTNLDLSYKIDEKEGTMVGKYGFASTCVIVFRMRPMLGLQERLLMQRLMSLVQSSILMIWLIQ